MADEQNELNPDPELPPPPEPPENVDQHALEPPPPPPPPPNVDLTEDRE